MCAAACWLLGWGAIDWRPGVTTGRLLGCQEKLLAHCAFVLVSRLRGAGPCRFPRGGRWDQGCCCAVSLMCRSAALEASASSSR